MHNQHTLPNPGLYIHVHVTALQQVLLITNMFGRCLDVDLGGQGAHAVSGVCTGISRSGSTATGHVSPVPCSQTSGL